MKTYLVPQTDITVSRIAYGCAFLGGKNESKAGRLIHTACDNGITFFDHADIYGSEEVFGKILQESPGLRDRIVIQSKCGQYVPEGHQPGDPIFVNFSREHIATAVDGSLRRLRTDHLDILLLHLSDTLLEPEEVAEAFDKLKRSGKVRHFGVSNHSPIQIELLKRCVPHPLVANQVHISFSHPYLFTTGIEVTLEAARGPRKIPDTTYAALAGNDTIDYCRLNRIQIQAWSPLRGIELDATKVAASERGNPLYMLNKIARQKNTTPCALALAWLLYHPGHIVPVIGSSNPEHIAEACAADSVNISREEWYTLLASASGLEHRVLYGSPN